MINFEKNQIVMTRLFAKKCTDTSSEEYAHLQSVRRDYLRSWARILSGLWGRSLRQERGGKNYKRVTFSITIL